MASRSEQRDSVKDVKHSNAQALLELIHAGKIIRFSTILKLYLK